MVQEAEAEWLSFHLARNAPPYVISLWTESFCLANQRVLQNLVATSIQHVLEHEIVQRQKPADKIRK